jgi:hypothetical protein
VNREGLCLQSAAGADPDEQGSKSKEFFHVILFDYL